MKIRWIEQKVKINKKQSEIKEIDCTNPKQMSSQSSSPKPQAQVENVSCLIPESPEIGGVYIGNIYGAQNTAVLKQYGIRAVITLLSAESNVNYHPQIVPFHLTIHAHDHDSYQLQHHLQQCIRFIQRCRKLTNVYVHCFAGVSRSVTVCVAYIMWKFKWKLSLAMQFTRAKRVVANPNEGFMRQLLKFQNQLELNEGPLGNINFQSTSRIVRTPISPASQLTSQNHKRKSSNLQDNMSNSTKNILAKVTLAEEPKKLEFQQGKQRRLIPTTNRATYMGQTLFLGESLNAQYQTQPIYQTGRQQTQANGQGYDFGQRRGYELNLGRGNTGKKFPQSNPRSANQPNFRDSSRPDSSNRQNFYHHNSIPIPKILSRNTNYNQQSNVSSSIRNDNQRSDSLGRLHMPPSEIRSKRDVQRIQERKAKSRIIRPKDLPGYNR